MVSIVITLLIIIVVMALFLTSAILHILKIQKELEDIFKIEEEQDKALQNAGLYMRDLALAIKDIQDYLTEQQNLNLRKTINPFGGTIGEA